MRGVFVVVGVLAAAGCGGGAGVDAGPGPSPDGAPVDAGVVDGLCTAASPDAAAPGCEAEGDRLDEALELARLDRCTLGYAEGTLGTLYPASLAADADRLPW